MVIDREHWEKHFQGYVVYDCAMMDPERTFYVLVEDTPGPHRDPLPRTRFVFVRAGRPMDEGRFQESEVGHFGFTEMAYSPSAIEFVAVDTAQHVFSYDRNDARIEGDIPGTITGTNLHSSCTKVVRVGSSIYTVGWPRRVMVRQGINQWALVDAGLPIPRRVKSGNQDDLVEAISNYTFHDLHGFSESDMYAVGDAGEIWQYDGSRWTRCAFPTNEPLRTVTCADDKVYITTLRGHVWAGRGNAWKLVCDEERSIPFRDTAWFAGKLWLGCDYGVWTLEGDSLSRDTLPTEVFLVSGRLDGSPDGKHLLTAGQVGAAMFDGATWNVLWSADEM
ncbi:MAG: hypothetical protein IPK82_24810 [Polyangiaceae bacterium]|nr:hypothetical protein [Polyangiaceae bacterium]